jgi:hypothetical protein
MTQTNRSPQTEPRRRRRVRRTRRTTAGVVAQYIHELSERHGEDARRARQLIPAPAVNPSAGC